MTHYNWTVHAPNQRRMYKRRDSIHGIKCHASATYPGAYIEIRHAGELMLSKQPGARWIKH